MDLGAGLGICKVPELPGLGLISFGQVLQPLSLSPPTMKWKEANVLSQEYWKANRSWRYFCQKHCAGAELSSCFGTPEHQEEISAKTKLLGISLQSLLA